MITVGQFTFRDNLQARYVGSVPLAMQVSATSTEELIAFRLLLGTLKIEDTLTGKHIKQDINYSLNDFEKNSVISARVFRDFFEPDIEFADVENYIFNSVRHGNKRLFKNFLLEITHYFFCSAKGNELAGFLHIYRALELISYCFPLFYASKSKDYHGTFDTLKKFFKESDSERSFFKNFVHNHLFQNDPLLDIWLPIQFDNSNPILQEQYFKSFFKIQQQAKKDIEVLDYTNFSEVVLKRRGLISLMINIRNRNFHLLEGDYNQNLTTDELFDFNGFYKNFNQVFLNWLSLIFLKIFKKAIETES